MALSHKVAICTKYHGPTDSRGAIITASTESGRRASIPYPHELNTDAAHEKAAKALMTKMGWRGRLLCGGIKGGYCCVMSSSRSGKRKR
jgi:hypothetical protein